MLKFRPPFGYLYIENNSVNQIMHRKITADENIIIKNDNDELRHLGIKNVNWAWIPPTNGHAHQAKYLAILLLTTNLYYYYILIDFICQRDVV